MSIYDFTVSDAQAKPVVLSQYKGRVLLIVNVASKCGFTAQYEELQRLYSEYKDQGLMILGFPCNQFLDQEPGSNEEIQSFCRLNYGVDFPVLAKIDVNGPQEDPLYTYLKAQDAEEEIDVPADFEHYELFKKVAGGEHWGRNIPWNFTKFLFDHEGRLIGRYAPTADMGHIEQKIKKLLAGLPKN